MTDADKIAKLVREKTPEQLAGAYLKASRRGNAEKSRADLLSTTLELSTAVMEAVAEGVKG